MPRAARSATGKRWYVAATNDYRYAGWVDWPGQVKGRPGTLAHYQRWASELVFEDGQRHPPESWQLDWVRDLLRFAEAWLVVSEGNSKTTLLAGVALYHLETVWEPWVPLAASTRDQAGILFKQAQGFVDRTPGLRYNRDLNPAGPFISKGTRHIDHQFHRGSGLQVYAANEEGGDGVIPTLALVDEGHRLRDLGVYRLWKGKLGKRGGHIGLISTAGEPGRDFEKTRTRIKRGAKKVTRRGTCFARYEGSSIVLHDYAVPKVEMVEDLRIVKEANPLSTITIRTLRAKRDSDTLDFGEGWLRLTCCIPARSSKAGIHQKDWDEAQLRCDEWEDAPDGQIPEGVPVALGIDIGWVNDTTALVPLWIPEITRRLIGQAEIIVPPRDGSQLDPLEIHEAAQRLNERNPVYMVVMDMSRANETAMWLAGGGDDGEFRLLERSRVIDRTQSNKHAAEDYDAFMEALRGGAKADEKVRERWLRHSGDPDLSEQVLNAMARKLPGDRYRFDRPTPSRNEADQDMRVIDGLQAAAMVNRTAAAALSAPSTEPQVAVRARGQRRVPTGTVATDPSTACATCAHPLGSHIPGGPCNVGRSGAWGEVPCPCAGFAETRAA